MTAPDNLTAWKDGLMRELVLRTRRDETRDNAMALLADATPAARAIFDAVDPQLLITRTLAALDLDISLAKVATEGEKVADVFFVTRGGHRLTDDAERAALIDRLAEAVEAV